MYPTTVQDIAGGASTWTNPTNVEALDGNYASTSVPNSNTGWKLSDKLVTTNYLFNIPAVSIIDGIYVEIIGNVSGQTPFMQIGGSLYKGGVDQNSGRISSIVNLSGTICTFGSATDLWGLTLTAADINNAGFGFAMTAQNEASTQFGSYNIDAIRITLYYHLPAANVPTRHVYKVYSHKGKYLGNLPNVTSPFKLPLDINTAGTQITIDVAMSIDTAGQAVNYYTDESGNPYTDEAGAFYYASEGVLPIVSNGLSGTDSLIKNGNKLIIQENSYYYPNGITVFRGEIDRWEAKVGAGADDSIKLTVYSNGQDLDHMIARGAPFSYTTDQSQTSQNETDSLLGGHTKFGYQAFGQTFTTGSSVTNVGQINVMLGGNSPVTVTLWDSYKRVTNMGSVTLNVNVANGTVVSFAFPRNIAVNSSTQYFFDVVVPDTASMNIYASNTDVYSGGSMYVDTGGGGGYGAVPTKDLYFVTASGLGTTSATYTNQDPTTGMLVPIMQDYALRGGALTTTSSSVDATGFSLTYGFSVQTVFEAIKVVKSLAPSTFYYFADVATDVLYMKQSSSSPDILLVKGKHIQEMTLSATIENIKNDMLFTGGSVSGSNLYKEYTDNASMGAYGIRLDRQSDNRVTLVATANAIGSTFIASNKDEQYATTVTVLAKTMDLMTLKPGKIIGFRGFGTFVDRISMQIVRVEYTAELATLTLGIIPKKMVPAFEKVTRGLVAAQTVANPSAPS